MVTWLFFWQLIADWEFYMLRICQSVMGSLFLTSNVREERRMLKFYKCVFVFLALVALMLLGIGQAFAELLFSRDLPTINLNNVAGASRSNVCWADGSDPLSYQASGDDFKIGVTGTTYRLDTITLWTVDSPVTGQYRLLGGPEGGNITLKSSAFSYSVVHYASGVDYEANSGDFYPLYKVNFNVNNWTVDGDKTYQFFIDSPVFDFGGGFKATSFLHASNAALSGGTQDGANGIFLLLNMSGAFPDGTPGTVVPFDSNGNGWDKSSDANVMVYGSQVPLPGAMVLLGAGLTRLVIYRRRKAAATS
jgi:hypothetical protein